MQPLSIKLTLPSTSESARQSLGNVTQTLSLMQQDCPAVGVEILFELQY